MALVTAADQETSGTGGSPTSYRCCSRRRRSSGLPQDLPIHS
jgi:hypothetical protein